MDFKQIQELIKMVNKSNLSEVTIEEKGFRLTIKQKDEQFTQLVSASAPVVTTPTAVTASPTPSIVAETPKSTTAPSKTEESSAINLITIKSPMIGTFYRRPAPDKPLFVEIGSEVAPGKVVCIIEAMKLFNEIESEVKGKIVKILVEDSSPVEYDQPLFLVDPS